MVARLVALLLFLADCSFACGPPAHGRVEEAVPIPAWVVERLEEKYEYLMSGG